MSAETIANVIQDTEKKYKLYYALAEALKDRGLGYQASLFTHIAQMDEHSEKFSPEPFGGPYPVGDA